MARFSLLALYTVASLLAAAAQAKLVKFEAVLSQGQRSPNGGKLRPQLLINGQSPGPALIVDQGDRVEFTVKNEIPGAATAIHFHGIQQQGTPWSDGTPGLSQKAIRPGGTFVYRWVADNYGTYFYHGHYRGQIADGLFGPIYIRPSSQQSLPFSQISSDASDIAAMTKAVADPNLVVISDWSGYTYAEWINAEKKTNLNLVCTDSIMVNGEGAVHCPGVPLLNSLQSPLFRELLNGSSLSDQGCLPPIPPLEGNFTHNLGALPKGFINGCDATKGSQKTFSVDPAKKWVSMNFISSTTVQYPVVSIDGHKMWVYEVDGLYVNPVQVEGIPIGNGERYSVMVQLNQPHRVYQMRFANIGLNQIISGFALLQYGKSTVAADSATQWFNYAGANNTADAVRLAPPMLQNFQSSSPCPYADATHILEITRSGASWAWTLSGEGRFPQDGGKHTPFLFKPNGTSAKNRDLVIRTQNNTWIDLVLSVLPSAAAPGQPPHPIHKHGVKGYIIGSGAGPFQWSNVAEAQQAVPQSFNLQTPILRDTFTTPVVAGPPGAWMVVRYHSSNPGAWFLHCHIQTHFTGGMAMAILDGIDTWPKIPKAYYHMSHLH